MPTIAIVDGVKILMFYNDHIPPHFHAILAEDEVVIAILNLDVIPRLAPSRKAQASHRLGEGASG